MGAAAEQVLGRYALFGEIASGGMATVHYGRLLGQGGFSRTVAIKRLHPQFAKEADFADMLMDEARIAARIQHPNVVQTLDVVATDGELFVVMEYVLGETLSKLIRRIRKRGEKIPLDVVGAIMTGALDGLHAAHDAKNERGEPLGLIHRDVSPQNVMVGKDGVPRVLDFGVAKAAGRIHSTQHGQVKGKLSYMPREQLKGGQIDRRADVYSAGLVMWEMLVGRRAFDGESDVELYNKVLEGVIPPVSSEVEGLSEELDEVIAKATAPEPDDRYQNASDFAADVERVCGVASRRKVSGFVDTYAANQLADREAKIKEIESVSSSSLALAGFGPMSGSQMVSQSSGSMPPPSTVSGTAATAVDVSPNSGSRTQLSLGEDEERRSPVGWLLLVGAAILLLAIVGTATLPWMTGQTGDTSAALVGAATEAAGAEETTATAAPVGEAGDAAPAPSASAEAADSEQADADEADADADEADADEADADEGAKTAAKPKRPTPTQIARWRSYRRPRPAPKPAPEAEPATAPTPKPAPRKPTASCDPPYVVQPDGTRRYKVECL